VKEVYTQQAAMHLNAVLLAAVGVAVAAHEGQIDCGGHFVDSCSACPQGQGRLWCNGDCIWHRDECVDENICTWLFKILYDGIWGNWWKATPCSLLSGIIFAVYGVIYKNKVVNWIPDHLPEKDADWEDWREDWEREFGIFSVLGNPSQCLWAFCCAPVVAAKNYDKGSVTPRNFWWACGMIFCGLGSAFYPLFCFMSCIRASWAAKLDRNLGYRPNFLKSWLLTLFCFPCDVGRESLEVDHRLGVKIYCPFIVEVSVLAEVKGLTEKTERACHRMCTSVN